MVETSTESRGVHRTIGVIVALNRHNGSTITELADKSKISRPALHRILAALLAGGYVTRRRADGRYFLAPRITTLSEGYNRIHWLADLARPSIDALQRNIKWPTDFVVPDDNRMHVVHTSRDRSPYVIDTGKVGDRIIIHRTSLGLSFAAFCEIGQRDALIRLSMETTRRVGDAFDDEVHLCALLQDIKAQGFATRFKIETAPGTNSVKTGSIAVPVLVRGSPIGSIGFTFIASALSVEDAKRLHLAKLQSVAREIAKRVICASLDQEAIDSKNADREG